MIQRARLPLCLTLLLAAAPTHAATLAEAMQHWTGVTPDVIGDGARVRVVLPPESPVPAFTALAHAAQHGTEPGWTLTDLALPNPTRLRSGDTLHLGAQQGQAWLGAGTAEAHATLSGITLDHGTDRTRLDHAALSVSAQGGPVALAIDADGLRTGTDAALAPLLPQHLTLRGHTTPAGATALAALVAGHAQGAAPVTVDRLGFDIGPAQFTATGTITFLGQNDRRGQIELTANHFGDLLRQIPATDAAARVYPVLMILRQMGQKREGRLVWTAVFSGASVLVNGVDVGALLGG